MTAPTEHPQTDHAGLIRRLERGVSDNRLDVQIEVALFEPDATYSAARANNAGTKVIYTTQDGREETYCANDWSHLAGPLRSVAMKSLRQTEASQ